MTAAIVYLLVVGVLLGVAARAGEAGLRLARRSTRHVWAGALAILLVLAARAGFAGPHEVPVPLKIPAAVSASADAVDPGSSRWANGVELVRRARSFVAGAPGAVTERIGRLVPASIGPTVAPVWATMSVAVFLLLVITYWRFNRAVRSLPAVTLHGRRVRVSPASGPAVVGLRDPQVVVPAWLLDAPDAEQQLAIAHECEHLAARDPQLIVGACVALVAMPWHPAVWWMLSRLRLAVEMDCDARVLAAGTPRQLYGNTLIDIAARGGRLPLGAPALADHTTHLERRLIAMTATPTSFPRTRLLAAGAVALLTVAAACEARIPTSPQIEALDAAAVEQHALTKTALAGDSITWYVDGRMAAADEARSIAATSIASVEVRKGASRSEIRILTKGDSSAAGHVLARSPSPLPLDTTPVGKHATPQQMLSGDFAGLIYIDDRLSSAQDLARLAPDRISSMEVVKGAAAMKLYDDPRAANGVIRVTMKR